MKTISIVLGLSFVLSGCAAKLQMPRPTAIATTKYLRIVNLNNCQRAFGKAATYLHLSGVQLVQDNCADKVLTCYRATPLLLRLLNPIPVRIGEALDDSAYVEMSGDTEYDAKLILHELMHLYYNAPHTMLGVMNPIADVGCNLGTDLTTSSKKLLAQD